MITADEFSGLKEGRKIKDGDGRVWVVLYAVKGGLSEAPGDLEVGLRAPDGGEMPVGWDALADKPGIYNDEFEYISELNHPGAYVHPE